MTALDVGDVVLVRIPEPEGSTPKLRPALVIARLPGLPPGALVCGVSSRVDRRLDGWDLVVDDAHPDFGASGLRIPSVVRAGWVASFPDTADFRVVGRLSADTIDTIRRRLAAVLLAG